jgi:hypothetical protein
MNWSQNYDVEWKKLDPKYTVFHACKILESATKLQWQKAHQWLLEAWDGGKGNFLGAIGRL